ncbi:uncharacterized protein N7484_003343 [Penicillium longicatenatum]|uniref:uncharacterized protein n=1 Tax=Penicillium longicatenatum TaxID=1561947 RepID=UPI00254965E6|nr:uncharacterized protein N7484_003343 [Penicillium longicatenatum]KAJ5649620.1 hypothetical protein N7484_003343 [Penicillium longicatenatum]
MSNKASMNRMRVSVPTRRAAQAKTILSHAHSTSSSDSIARSLSPEQLLYDNVDIFDPLSSTIPALYDLASGARTATRAEQKMTLTQAFRLYPKAIP